MSTIDISDPTLYAAMSEEELATHIKNLQEILRLRKGQRALPTRNLLQEMLDPAGDNFMGMGMSLMEFMTAGHVMEVQNNLVFQGVEERLRRLSLIVELGTELTKIREKTQFATRLAQGVIEDIIRGDWWAVRDQARHFAFEGEDAWLRETQGPIYAQFAVLCQKAFDTRPEAKGVGVEEPDKN